MDSHDRPVGGVVAAELQCRQQRRQHPPVVGANLVAVGTVDHIDEGDRLVYVAVDWAQLAPDQLPTPDEFMATLRQPVDRLVLSGAAARTA